MNIVFIFFFLASLAFGKDISQIITYREWTDLVKHSAGKIPELRPLWEWQRRTGHYVYMGGGVLRGLMQWLHHRLQNHSLEEVRKMKVPKIEDLLILKGADIDLFAPDNVIAKLKKDLPQYANWDILGDSSHRVNIRLGGPTVEKIRVNPNYFDDPLNGLRDYYNGKLVFYWTPEEEFRELYWVKERGNTKTSEALRFLRMEKNMPEVKATQESYDLIGKISEVEMSLVPSAGIDIETDWWIQKKGLAKLYKSTGNNFPETLDILRKRNLLHLLGHKGFRIEEGPQEVKLVNYVDALVRRGFSIDDLKMAERMQTSSIEAATGMMKKLLTLCETPDDFLKVTKFAAPNPSPAYRKLMSSFIIENMGMFFDNLKPPPSIAQVNELIDSVEPNSIAHNNVTLRALEIITNADDYEQLNQPIESSQSKELKTRMATLFEDHPELKTKKARYTRRVDMSGHPDYERYGSTGKLNAKIFKLLKDKRYDIKWTDLNQYSFNENYQLNLIKNLTSGGMTVRFDLIDRMSKEAVQARTIIKNYKLTRDQEEFFTTIEWDAHKMEYLKIVRDEGLSLPWETLPQINNQFQIKAIRKLLRMDFPLDDHNYRMVSNIKDEAGLISITDSIVKVRGQEACLLTYLANELRKRR